MSYNSNSNIKSDPLSVNPGTPADQWAQNVFSSTGTDTTADNGTGLGSRLATSGTGGGTTFGTGAQSFDGSQRTGPNHLTGTRDWSSSGSRSTGPPIGKDSGVEGNVSTTPSARTRDALQADPASTGTEEVLRTQPKGMGKGVPIVDAMSHREENRVDEGMRTGRAEGRGQGGYERDTSNADNGPTIGRIPTPTLPPLGTDTTTTSGAISSAPSARTRAALESDFTPTSQKPTDHESILGRQPKRAGEGQPIVHARSVDNESVGGGAGVRGGGEGWEGRGEGRKYERGSSDPTKPFGTGFSSTTGTGANTGTGMGIGREAPGVIESRPGLVESSNIDPLSENSNRDDGWANATIDPNAKSTPFASGTGMGYSTLPSTSEAYNSLPSRADVGTTGAQAKDYTYDTASAAGNSMTQSDAYNSLPSRDDVATTAAQARDYTYNTVSAAGNSVIQSDTYNALPSRDDVATTAAQAKDYTYNTVSAAGNYASEALGATGLTGTGGSNIGPEAPGVIENEPGLVESSNIDPLSETSNKDDGWANATVNPGSRTTTSGSYPTGIPAGAEGTTSGEYSSARSASDNPYSSTTTSSTTTTTKATTDPSLPAPVTTTDLSQTVQAAGSYAAGFAAKAASAVFGAGKVVYGAVAEDESAKKQGREEVRESTGI